MKYQNHINNGVIFKSTENVYIEENVKIGEGTVIHSGNHLLGNTVIGKNVILYEDNHIQDSTVGNGCQVTKSVLKNCKIGDKTTVGPFANVHTGSIIGKECRIGNFVEIKNSTIGSKTKVAHLAYVGDANIGDLTNVGCGSIFVNYDGKNKHRSYIGNSVFIGSNSNIIAPVSIEDNAYIAAGTTVTVDLPEKCLCIGRNRETIKENRSKYYKNNFSKKYFGTDGIRGIYSEFLTDNIAYMVGNYLGYSSDGGKIVVGRDNRVSGEKLAESLIRGITDAGADVIDLSIVGTPVVAYATESSGANYGVVISASHNPKEYNGIKIFNYDGRKLSDLEEVEIEAHIEKALPFKAIGEGNVSCGAEYVAGYINYLKSYLPRLSDKSIVVDLSNGALSGYGQQLLSSTGASIVAIGNDTDGNKINDGCGALYPEKLSEKVRECEAFLGFAFDGDGDRIIVSDKDGRIINGDEIIYIIAKYLIEKNQLKNHAVVGTIMTNKGVEIALQDLGIELLRTPVGDHYVAEKITSKDLSVGGEQSGHIIISELLNTGDGLATACYLLKIIAETSLDPATYPHPLPFPSVSSNIITDKKSIIENDERLKSFVKTLENENPDIRIILRASGTEPKLRITAEAQNESIARDIVARISSYIQKNILPVI